MTVTLTICQTCKRADSVAVSSIPQTDGQVLTAEIETLAAQQNADLIIKRQDCLWACKQSCAILMQAEGKCGYLAGHFEASPEAAKAIVDWCQKMAASNLGQIAYREWPEGMKGKFIARIPPQE